jgi:hypothetical protein
MVADISLDSLRFKPIPIDTLSLVFSHLLLPPAVRGIFHWLLSPRRACVRSALEAQSFGSAPVDATGFLQTDSFPSPQTLSLIKGSPAGALGIAVRAWPELRASQADSAALTGEMTSCRGEQKWTYYFSGAISISLNHFQAGGGTRQISGHDLRQPGSERHPQRLVFRVAQTYIVFDFSLNTNG